MSMKSHCQGMKLYILTQFGQMNQITIHFHKYYISFIQLFITIRYKIEVQDVHNSDKVRFLFWDAQCIEILKISAADLRAQMIKVCGPLRSFPTTHF